MACLLRGMQLLGSFLLWVLLAASVTLLTWDLPEPGSCTGKIRVHLRDNLWATGHFMGKKSLKPLSPSPLGTAPHTSLRDQQLQLSHDLLKSFLLRRALSLSSWAAHTQEEGTRGPAPAPFSCPISRRLLMHLQPMPGMGWRCSVGSKPPRQVAEWVLGEAPFGCKPRAQSVNDFWSGCQEYCRCRHEVDSCCTSCFPSKVVNKALLLKK